MKTLPLAVATAALALFAALAPAQTPVFSNFPPANMPRPGTSTQVTPGTHLSVPFTLWDNAYINGLWLSFDGAALTQDVTVQVSLARDAGGVPGEVIASGSAALLPGRDVCDVSFGHLAPVTGAHHIVISGSSGTWQWAHVQPAGSRTPHGFASDIALQTSADGTTWTPLSPDSFGGITLVGEPVCRTDVDGDGDHGTDADIEGFFRCIAGDCFGLCFPSIPDFNRDGDSGTDADIESFFRALAGADCLQ